jgi:hypothetical protein
MTTGACVARLSDDRSLVLCGHRYLTGHYCATERNEPTLLARVESWSTIVASVDSGSHRHLVFTSDWEVNDGIAKRSRGALRREQHGNAPTRRGWLRNAAGGRVRSRKSFALTTLVKCPQCGWLNSLEAGVLDVREVPLQET